jgi:hypothetical protein
MAAERGWGIPALGGCGIVVAGLLATLPAHAADDAPPRAETPHTANPDEVRRKLLLEHLQGRYGVGFFNVFPAVYGSVFLTASIVAAVEPGGGTQTQTSIFVTTTGVLSAAAFGSYLAPKPLRIPILTTLEPLWISGLALTMYCDPSESRQSKQVLGIALGTGLAAAPIPLLDALLEPPLDPWALDSDRRALETADKATLHSHVVRAEQNLARTTRPLRLVMPLVYLAGVTGMTIAATRSPQSHDATQSATAFGILYGSFATLRLIFALAPSVGQGYERALQKVRLAPIGPQGSAGVTALWRF